MLVYKILDKINNPNDLKKIDIQDLPELSSEIRNFLVKSLSEVGGHLGSNLGVVELTIALHYVFNSPVDKIIWDIGHQAYIHKILTERKDKISTIRQKNGISGFCLRSESEHDIFGAGHSSTSISAAIGIAKARDLEKKDFHVVSVIGDSGMTGGIAYEAMNNIGLIKEKMIVVLNDNDMSIAPAIGSLRNYLVNIVSSSKYIKLRRKFKEILPKFASMFAKKAESAVKEMIYGANIFEAMGFYYIGVVDGHDVIKTVEILEKIKQSNIQKPVLLHIKTEKGKGYEHAENAEDKLHGVSKFDVNTGKPHTKSNNYTYSDAFANCLINLAQKDDKVVAITAGMPNGTGLDKFAEKFPDRMFDVAIAEQHAVTFAGGLATQGFKPYCAIYSTFLQRAYDQVIHDVVLQKLPVKFAIDRAGFVGNDGATHVGAFDISYLSILPNIVVMAPSSELELVSMMKLANNLDLPCAFRYPRQNVEKIENFDEIKPCELGKMNDIEINNSEFVIISYGTVLENVIKAVEMCKNKNVNFDIIDGRFAKPLDEDRLLQLQDKKMIITVEEGSCGGFGALVADFFAKNVKFTGVIKQVYIENPFLEGMTINEMKNEAKLDAEGLSAKFLSFVDKLR